MKLSKKRFLSKITLIKCDKYWYLSPENINLLRLVAFDLTIY